MTETPDFDSTEEIDVDALSAELNATLNKIEEISAKRADVQKQLEAAKALFQALTNESSDLRREAENARWEARRLEKQKANAERRRLAREEAKRLEEEFDRLSADLDELTKDCFWRDGNNDKGLRAFPHQISGGKKLAVAKKGILADKRGLGKTLGGIVWLDFVQAKKILLIAPNDVVDQFVEEIQTWAPHRTIMNLAGMPPGQRSIMYGMLPKLDKIICTMNYEAWRRDKTIIDDLCNAGFDTVLLDEAHRAKSADKITARGIFQVIFMPNKCNDCGKINCNKVWMQNGNLVDFNPNKTTVNCQVCGSYNVKPTVENVLSMTGTPLLNKPQELFSLLHIVDPRRYDSESSFTYDFCRKAYGSNRWEFRPGGLDRLIKHMDTFFVQRDRDSIGITVPPPAIFKHELVWDTAKYPKQFKAYRNIVEAAAMVIEKTGEKFSMFNFLDMLTRLRQTVVWPAGIIFRDYETHEILAQCDVEESQKLDAVDELLSELLEEGERTIVFSKFKEPLRVLQKRAEHRNGVSTVMATGDQSQEWRNKVRMDFDLKTAPEKPLWQAAFATYDAFGTGVNLNGARHMILIDREWSGGKEDQAIGRIDRINSPDQANVHIFEMKSSIDMFMAELIEHKRAMTEGFESGMVGAKDLLKAIRDGDI